MTSFQSIAGYLGSILLFVGFIVYLTAIYKGKVVSNRVAWGVWVVVQALFVFSYYESVGLVSSMWVPVVYLIGTALVFIFLLKYSTKGYWTWVEKTAIVGVVIILLFWFIYQSPVATLTLTLFVDIIGAIPLIVTVWKDPTADYAPAWYFGFFSNLLNLFAIEQWDYANAVYPLYLALMTLAVASILRFRYQK